jgi:hypothetical protein
MAGELIFALGVLALAGILGLLNHIDRTETDQ